MVHIIGFRSKLFTATDSRARCENPARKSVLISRERRKRENRKEEEQERRASESRAAAIAGHVIGRKRNYGVHGATARRLAVVASLRTTVVEQLFPAA